MILRADARRIPLADETVQCCVCSPPYWGLRRYSGLPDDHYGLEPTLDLYVQHTVEIFREVRRVLKKDGTLWLNLGDCYAHGVPGGGSVFDNGRTDGRHSNESDKPGGRTKISTLSDSLKPKDLCGVPWRVAFALQADGWWLRSDIIWAKPNPMPESVTDRPTRSHEYIFLLTKSERYFYDADAIREPQSDSPHNRGQWRIGDAKRDPGSRTDGMSREAFHNPAGRNKRDVWTIPSQPTPEAHFATFPEALVLPCVLAGTSAKGECVRCGKNWERVAEFKGGPPRGIDHRKRDDFNDNCKTAHSEGTVAGSALSRIYAKYGHPERITLGWRPTCRCDAQVRPNLVLDPFLGSGTVGIVAERLGRRWVGVELSPDYIEIVKKRVAQMGLFCPADSGSGLRESPSNSSNARNFPDLLFDQS